MTAGVVTQLLMVWCPGHPRTKGSLEIISGGRGGRRAVAKDTEASSAWRATMKREALDARLLTGEPWRLLVSVQATFLVPFATADHGHAGDLDKLLRNLLDALEDAGVYANDRQVSQVHAVKRPAPRDDATGMWRSGVLIDVKGFS